MKISPRRDRSAFVKIQSRSPTPADSLSRGGSRMRFRASLIFAPVLVGVLVGGGCGGDGSDEPDGSVTVDAPADLADGPGQPDGPLGQPDGPLPLDAGDGPADDGASDGPADGGDD